MKIYTKTGDTGETSLFGGTRVKKNHSLINAYGTVDELNSNIGVVRSHNPTNYIESVCEILQNHLFVLGSDLATPLIKKEKIGRIGDHHIEQLESIIDKLDKELQQLTYFILPAGSPSAAYLHVCRTVCRRAERLTIEASEGTEINPKTITFLNRLSDLLFVMARFENAQSDIPETKWKVR